MNKLINQTLPDKGRGFNAYNRERNAQDQVGLALTIECMEALAAQWTTIYPAAVVQYGDISRVGGKAFPPHKGHMRGLEFDVRPFRRDLMLLPVSVYETAYDANLTQLFVGFARKIYLFDAVLFNDPRLIARGLTSPCAGHDNHLHFRLNPRAAQPSMK
jgi:murein endopeptidase